MSIPSVVIRAVRSEDAVDLQANCFSRNSLEEVEKQVEGSLADLAARTRFHLVAEIDGSVVGSAELKRETHSLLQHRAEWTGVVVCGFYQRRGIARSLLRETVARAAAWHIELLTVGVRGGTGAEEVYHRLGFREYARLPGGFREMRDGEMLVFDDVRLYLPVPAQDPGASAR